MSIFTKLHEVSRKRKIALMLSKLSSFELASFLDLGCGSVDDSLLPWTSYPRSKIIVALDLSERNIQRARCANSKLIGVVGDARALPFQCQCFDIVFSNAVIEHVGGPMEQAIFASEVRRVGSGYFITTPNKYFPIELHLGYPFSNSCLAMFRGG